MYAKVYVRRQKYCVRHIQTLPLYTVYLEKIFKFVRVCCGGGDRNFRFYTTINKKISRLYLFRIHALTSHADRTGICIKALDISKESTVYRGKI